MGWFDKQEERDLHSIAVSLEQIAQILTSVFVRKEPSSFQIIQLGENMPTNNSINAGNTGVFEITSFVPAGSALAPGNLPVWSSSDASVSLSAPAGITDGSQIAAAVPATDTAASFVLTANYTRKADGVVVTASVTVTINQPAPAEPTAFSIVQLS